MAAAKTIAAPSPLTLSRNPAELRRAVAVANARAQEWRLRYAELHMAYVQLLTHARAAVAAAAAGELAPTAYIAGHLEEIGLSPAPGAVPDALVAEGLAVAAELARERS
ncbi:hypothetical protein [Actinomadura sp. SCN-SB]|uniref:hypothetical protein n=1 Tax=Actinomadura sp. SCN-SB TaxID=3373092 RepID=UPI003751329B